MFKLETIMVKEVLTVKPETHIYDAMRLLLENRISGLPVIDDERNLVGIISEKDMLRLLVDDDVHQGGPVSEYMTKKVTAFSPDDTAVDVCEFFMGSPVRRVPVARDGKLVGVVSRRDILKLIMKMRGMVK
jgi:CBS domain-containing protein